MYDKTKTEELLKNIDDGIKIEDISKLLCSKIVGVRINGKRGQMSTTIDIKSMGLTNYDKIDSFVNNNMKKTVISFFDKDVIKKFDNIMNKVRQTMYRYSSTNDGVIYYMTEGNYIKFEEKFEKIQKEEFQNLKNELLRNLPEYKKTFKNNLELFVNSRGLEEEEKKLLFNSIMNRFPTKETICNNCSLSFYTVPFPVYNEANVKGLAPAIAKKLNEDKDTTAVETFYGMVGNNLRELFDLVYKCMEFVDNTPSMASKKINLYHF